jgi:thymidylate synthase (FAD)
MRIIEPNVVELKQVNLFEHIEVCGRTCYKSTDLIKEGSAEKFVENIKKRKHGSVLEHGTVYMIVPFNDKKKPANLNKLLANQYTKVNFEDKMYITTNYRVVVENDFYNLVERYRCEPTEHHEKRRTFRITCNRGVSHEYVRHRVMSFAQESQRYVNYTKEKFGGTIKVIQPLYFKPKTLKYMVWKFATWVSEKSYMLLIKLGATPQEAREVLTNSTATELIMTGFESQWQDFFALRCDKTAHPQAIEIANKIKEIF